MTGVSIAILAEIAQASRRRLLIEATPLSVALIRPLLLSDPSSTVEFLPVADMLRRNREWSEEGPGPWTYVTFPDHHTAADECCTAVAFFGSEHRMPLLEPLLCLPRDRPLVTLAAPSAERPREWRLIPFEAGEPGEPSVAAARSMIRWLVACLQDSMRQDPANVLSWASARARSARLPNVRRIHRTRAAEGLLRCWRYTDPAADRDLVDSTAASLEILARRPSRHGRASAERTQSR